MYFAWTAPKMVQTGGGRDAFLQQQEFVLTSNVEQTY